MVNCIYAKNCNSDWCHCKLNLYGGRPSNGTCLQICKKRESIDTTKDFDDDIIKQFKNPDEFRESLNLDIPIEDLTNEERIGLGDIVESGIKFIKGDKLAEFYTKVTGKGCKCSQRKDFLNRILSWKKSKEEKN